METLEQEPMSELDIAKSNANYWMKKYEIAQTQIEMLTAPETTKYVLRSYAELDSEQRRKIDNLMTALLEVKK